MPVHAFVDESQRGAYLVCAAVVAPADVGDLRQLLRGFCLPGQRRLHFKSESNAVASRSSMHSWRPGVQARIYRCQDSSTVRDWRQCLTALVHDLVEIGGERLVIESEQGQDERDKQVIFDALRRHGGAADWLRYGHMRPYEEPGLWAADAIAWAHGAGGRWRAQVEAIVAAVVNVETRD